jgi:hypothetical protein
MTPGRVKRLERYKNYGWLYAGLTRGGSGRDIKESVMPGYRYIPARVHICRIYPDTS